MAHREMKSDVAGRVWKIAATAGQTLDPADPVVILESMKMEIPLTAGRSCTLVEVRVRVEDIVTEGQVVAIIEV